MTSRISHTTVDCHDAYTLSTWWKGVLGYVDVADDPNEPGHEECMILAADGSHHVLFIEIQRPGDQARDPQADPAPRTCCDGGDAKGTKNRIHFDLRPTDGTQQREVDRLLGQGATIVADRRGIYGPESGWVTMADPEGNEFCVLSSDAELAARRQA